MMIGIAAASLFLSGLILSAAADVAIEGGNLRLRQYKRYDASHEIGRGCNSWSSPCTGEGNYCAAEENMCMEAEGTCQAMPEICTAEYDPVCGCDSNTHSNACQANSQGVNVWHMGGCEHGNSCGPKKPCENADQYFCSLEEGQCGEPLATQRGTCEHYSATGIGCMASWEPVCGCDGKIYSNSCVAKYQNGVNVSHGMEDSEDALPGGNCEIRQPTAEDHRAEREARRDEREERERAESSSNTKTSKKSKKRSRSSRSENNGFERNPLHDGELANVE